MQRILLVGSAAPLLNMLANIFSARGSLVCVSTDAEQARNAMTEFEPHVVLWDSEPGDDALNPAAFGFDGPTLVLTNRLHPERDHRPHRKVFLKPVSADELVDAMLEGAW